MSIASKNAKTVANGDYSILLRDGTKLTLSRGFRENVLKRWDRVILGNGVLFRLDCRIPPPAPTIDTASTYA